MKRKIHIVWANGTTHCGRPSTDADVHGSEGLSAADLCARCLKSHRQAHGVSNIYNTTGLGQ